MAGAELEAEEVLVRAGQTLAPLIGRHARELGAVDEDPTRRRFIELREQLDEGGLARAVLANDRDDRAGRQGDVDIFEDEPRCAGVREVDVIQPDAFREARRHGNVVVDGHRGGVVLQPGEAPRPVHPDTAQEPDLADGGADVRGQPRA